MAEAAPEKVNMFKIHDIEVAEVTPELVAIQRQ